MKAIHVISITHYKKFLLKRIITPEYAVDNDLDLYKLSAQLAVINKNHIGSIGEVDGQIARLKNFYDRERVEINDLIEEYNALVSLREQVQTFYTLSKKFELSDNEQLQKAICKRAMADNGILNSADVDALRRRAESLGKRIGSIKNGLEKCRQQYAVYKDIRDTYYTISKSDYISNLVEEARQRQEQVKKNKPRR